MINRALIRTKVVQIMYAYYLTRDFKDRKSIFNELQKSMDRSYQVYHDLLGLMCDLTHLQELNLDEAQYRYGATEEDFNPNMRFVENEFIARLKEDNSYQEYKKEHPFSWFDNQPLLRLLLDKVVKSEAYNTYMEMPATDFASDCQVWRTIMKDVLLVEENLLDELQNRSIYVGVDDVDTMGQFVLKTIRRFEVNTPHPLLPQYKDEEDEKMAHDLLGLSISNADENNALIDRCVEKGRWSGERIATMDRVIMLVALAELQGFPMIPVVVTLNEYIEIAKCFSTLQSGTFINGVLMAALTELRKDSKFLKQ